MKKGDVTCPVCRAGFQRLELKVEPPSKGEYHCPACGHTLEVFDGSKHVAYRLTVRPMKVSGKGKRARVQGE